MRISDWSSDVCSSDLPPHLQPDSSEQFAFFCKAVVRGVCRDINATGFHDVWIGSHETVAKVEGIVGRQLGDNHAHFPEIAGGLRSSPTRSIRSDLDGQRVSPDRKSTRMNSSH